VRVRLPEGKPAHCHVPKVCDEMSKSSDGLREVRFLTVAEVAAVMRVSKMTVYRMVHSGELPAVRVGRSFRVPEKAVQDYLKAAFFEAG
jgi:excisionase family DNA binding protein